MTSKTLIARFPCCLGPLLLIAFIPLSESAFGQSRRIYLANDDHTDFLWTADEETYERVFQEMIDYYLSLANQTDANPAPYQCRFNCDGSYWLWVYEKERTLHEFQRVVQRLKTGHLSAPMTTLVSCYGGQPAEAVLRGMYYAGRLERRFDLRFPLAVAMENQTVPLGLASLWSGSGARYSWRGVCACASRIPTAVHRRRPHEIYWYTGLDGGRILMKWHSVAPSGNKSIGGYAEAFDPVAAIAYLDANAEFLLRYRAPGAVQPYAVRGAFGFGWDALDRKTGQPCQDNPKAYPLTEHFHIVAEQQTTADRQVISSNEEDFFRDFESHYGDQLPAESVTYGNEWELYSASMAETSSHVRRSVEKLRPAELMATLVSLEAPDFLQGRETTRDLAFTNLGLYWEHDWTADGPVPRSQRAAWQERLADEIARYVDGLHADAVKRLGTLIQQPESGEQRFYVLNPLGWTRTDYADFVYHGAEDIHVRDAGTGNDVPHQFVRRDGVTRLRVLARDIPSAGYKVYELRPGSGSAPTDGAAVVGPGNTTLENTRVKIGLDPDGAIASLIVKSQPDMELAATIDGLKLNDLAADKTHGDPIVVENAGPVSVTLKCASSAGLPHSTRITLVRDLDRVEIRNEITENFADVRHWSFSLNLDAPNVHAEEIGAIIRVKKKSDGGDYADTHARYDYATLNHFADITNGANTLGVTLANADCAFFRLGRSTPTELDAATAQINVLAGGQVDGPRLGIPRQNGTDRFLHRFALRPHAAYDPVAAMKFALEGQNPLVTGAVTGKASSPYPSDCYSFLTVDHPGVLLWVLKPHEDGIAQGVIARVWNVSDRTAHCSLSLTPGLAAAVSATHIETDQARLPVTGNTVALTLAPCQLQTLRLALSP